MRVRFSTSKGMNVVCDSTSEILGQIAGILIHPDTGGVEGFFLATVVPMSGTPFLSALDIIRWGTHVHVRDADAVFPAEERIRLQPLLEDRRTVLNQRVRTEGGRSLGVCRDVQFHSDSMRCEWLFPRRWWRWAVPLPFSDVVEVRPDAIIVRDPKPPVQETVQEPQENSIDLLQPVPGIGGVPES
ncbi:MAG: hypothetical protein PHU04_02555 [Candidatus Peribacteraceae bacterium]|nr:hypothetical protein [Candidatus Peribacteraceae bacterium]